LADDFLSEAELAAALGKSQQTIQAWRRKGCAPPCHFVGKTPYFSKIEVKEWLLAK
jgi:predicted DNA-binding transcriptional regulator AlpA